MIILNLQSCDYTYVMHFVWILILSNWKQISLLMISCDTNIGNSNVPNTKQTPKYINRKSHKSSTTFLCSPIHSLSSISFFKLYYLQISIIVYIFIKVTFIDSISSKLFSTIGICNISDDNRLFSTPTFCNCFSQIRPNKLTHLQ